MQVSLCDHLWLLKYGQSFEDSSMSHHYVPKPSESNGTVISPLMLSAFDS
ncbi:hypothetical protein EV14_0556 [Prochlorococcus sp. MIT 0703]|nr:hypothetical protein EV12_1948 [Prochlorococcus sp. MIT 0701]KGG36147.1 hypothetical protein EV14_0556 [Prochlorococcus sp. MIT 0703]